MESHVGVKVEEERSIIIMEESERESKEKEKFPKGLTFTHCSSSFSSSYALALSLSSVEAKHKSKITSKPLISPIDGFYFLLQLLSHYFHPTGCICVLIITLLRRHSVILNLPPFEVWSSKILRG